ncbi:MAG: DUF86 domain-containing protein [Deltaproteobacteria bacterium]|nr:DUF86 domain-containing protein [Deltaproteobacteria bacterium]MBW2256053.1 DUF86 domain-containing protein [Deltaproteobacteria bacterium]
MVREETVRLRLDVLLDVLADLRRYRDTLVLDELQADRDKQYMVLHALQIAAQSSIDLAFHVLADAQAATPPTYAAAFEALGRQGRIPKDIVVTMTELAGLRNLITHRYADLDFALIHDGLREGLPHLEAFAAAVVGWLDASHT